MAQTPIFDKKNVIVTGGAGFIGSFLCERLLKDSRVICIDNFSTSIPDNINHLLKNQDFELIRADLADLLDLESFGELARFKLKFQGVQEIYHLACPTSVKNFDGHRMRTLLANSVVMRNVLDIAVKYKAKFFQASTSVIYGWRPEDGHLFREEEFGNVDHLQPRSCYDEGKRWAETMVDTYRSVHGLNVRIGRIFRTYGPRMPLYDGHMIPDFIIDATLGQRLVIYGDAEKKFTTSLMYVTDAVDAIAKLMDLAQDPGPVNIGSDQEVSLEDVARKIIGMTGSAAEVVHEPPLAFMSILGLPDLTKAKNELGWFPLVSLDQGLQKSIEYTVAHKGLVGSGG